MLRVKDKTLVPNGGAFNYVDTETGMRFSHPYYAQLEILAKKHRSANSLPIGSNWAEDFESNVCQHTGKACTDQTPEGKPTVAQMAKNFTTAMVEWVKSGFKVVSEDVYLQRLAQCQACPHYGGKNGSEWLARCGKCGCSGIKLFLPQEKCPLQPPKWGAVT